VPFRDQRLATAYRIALRACGFAGTTEAWLYRLAIERTAGASVTHGFGRTTTCRATAAALSVPVFDAGNISPHLAPLFQARRP